MYIKFNFGIPYVYCSTTDCVGSQKDIYLGSYKQYKRIHPKTRYQDIVRPKTLEKWSINTTWKIDTLEKIDADVRA